VRLHFKQISSNSSSFCIGKVQTLKIVLKIESKAYASNLSFDMDLKKNNKAFEKKIS
jgi:hypothetical protein